MPSGIYNRDKKAKTPKMNGRPSTPVLEAVADDVTNLVLQNGDREMVKSLLETELVIANKKKAKIEKLLAQLPV